MKRFALAALLALFAVPAWATVNIQQRGDGTGGITGGRGETNACLGGVTIPISVALNSVATGYGVSPITNALIRHVYSVQHGTTTGAGVNLKIYANGQATSAIRFVQGGTALATDAVLHHSAASAGQTRTISTMNQVSGATGMTNNVQGAGYYIAVGSPGGATGNVSATVFVVACPR